MPLPRRPRPPRRPRSRVRRLAREILATATLVLALAAARSTLADHYRVPSGSMRPTFEVGDHFLANKMAYGLRVPFTTWRLAALDEPAVGDVVVLESPIDGQVLVKRVLGVPGDVVAVRDGRVIRNGRLEPVRVEGRLLVESLGGREHGVRLTRRGGPDYGPTVIPPERVLVVGDNRGESLDGRTFGLVDRSALLGRAVLVFWRDGAPAWNGL